MVPGCTGCGALVTATHDRVGRQLSYLDDVVTGPTVVLFNLPVIYRSVGVFMATTALLKAAERLLRFPTVIT